MNPTLHGKAAVVTGASQGIGRAIALALARCGAMVHAVARDRAALEALASEVDGIVVHPLDLQDDDALSQLMTTLNGVVPPVGILVHAAGSLVHGRTSTGNVDSLDHQLAVNFRAPYLLTQRLLPALIAAGGDVVFVNSSAVRHPRAFNAQYAASKHALRGFADSLREEVTPHGVRVLSVFPGRTATPLQRRLHEEAGEEYRPEQLLQPEDVAQSVLGALALPPRAELTELHLRPARKG